MENRRLQEELDHKMSVVHSRLEAGESSYRILEKREATVEGSTQQLRQESELKMSEVGHDVARLRRQVEEELRQLNETTRAEMRQRDSHMQQLDAVAKSTILQLRSVEERNLALEQELKSGLERRLGIMMQGIAKNDQGHIDRMLAVERLLDKEALERVKGDAEVRQELQDIMQAVKNTAKTEQTERNTMHRELRGEVMDASKLAIDQVKTMREEAEQMRVHLREAIAEERAFREAATDGVVRKMETFTRMYETERERNHKSVRDALAQMFERTGAVQELIKGITKDSNEVKRLAAQVQEDAGTGLKVMAEKLEDGLRSLRAAQERMATGMADTKHILTTDLRDVKERSAQAEMRLRADVERSGRQDREANSAVLSRVREIEELARGVDQRVSARYMRLEQNVQRSLDAFEKQSRSGGVGGAKGSMAEHDSLRNEVFDQKQRVHTLELSVDLKLGAALDSLKAVQQETSLLSFETRAEVQGSISTLSAQVRSQEARIEVLEGEVRSHGDALEEHSKKQAGLANLTTASIVIQNAEVTREGGDRTVDFGGSATQVSFLQQTFDPAKPSARARRDLEESRITLKSGGSIGSGKGWDEEKIRQDAIEKENIENRIREEERRKVQEEFEKRRREEIEKSLEAAGPSSNGDAAKTATPPAQTKSGRTSKSIFDGRRSRASKAGSSSPLPGKDGSGSDKGDESMESVGSDRKEKAKPSGSYILRPPVERPESGASSSPVAALGGHNIVSRPETGASSTSVAQLGGHNIVSRPETGASSISVAELGGHNIVSRPETGASSTSVAELGGHNIVSRPETGSDSSEPDLQLGGHQVVSRPDTSLDVIGEEEAGMRPASGKVDSNAANDEKERATSGADDEEKPFDVGGEATSPSGTVPGTAGGEGYESTFASDSAAAASPDPKSKTDGPSTAGGEGYESTFAEESTAGEGTGPGTADGETPAPGTAGGEGYESTFAEESVGGDDSILQEQKEKPPTPAATREEDFEGLEEEGKADFDSAVAETGGVAARPVSTGGTGTMQTLEDEKSFEMDEPVDDEAIDEPIASAAQAVDGAQEGEEEEEEAEAFVDEPVE